MAVVRHKAAIHSGHFMVSDFEPDEQDEEDANVVPDRGSNRGLTREGSVGLTNLITSSEDAEAEALVNNEICNKPLVNISTKQTIRFSLSESNEKDIPLSSLFKSMSIAYRQRLTSPRWNRFRGLKLRWKDKIRMNNVIWRCWHMQAKIRRNAHKLSS